MPPEGPVDVNVLKNHVGLLLSVVQQMRKFGENASKIFSRTYNAAGKHVTCLRFENTTFRANDNVILTS